MTTNLLEPRKALNKAFLKIKPSRVQIEDFKTNLIQILDSINEKESEEFHKNLVIDFLKKTYYDPNFAVNTKGRNDLVIHNGKDAKTNVGVIIEAKSPVNKSEMITVANLNGKALQELVLYYMRERITHKNTELKHLVVTSIYEWFIFDAQLFNKLFAEKKSFVKQFIDFEEGRLSGKETKYFYNDIAKPFIASVQNEIVYAHFDIRKYDKPLRNVDKEDDKLLVALFKLLSPEHLLKLSFANDSNSLDKNFYSELLHIIGLTEVKEGGKKLIQRHKKADRNSGSLLENAIVQLDSLDKISRLQNAKQYGDTNDERLFTVALELTITWVNRILFLKLLEAQLISYHKGDRSYSFLNSNLISDYDNLNSLFFQVLARKPADRIDRVTTVFAKVPYLNSSLFEPTDLEHETLFVSQLEDHIPLKLLPNTVIKDAVGKKETGSKDALSYFFSFLDAYDFASEGSEDIQEDNKTLINASVLGLIFEKINGYKDGSIFTPGFITMYMSRNTIRRAVVQKFNEVKGWNCQSFEELIEDVQQEMKTGDRKEVRKKANAIINSLKICDPAVGSGHFLVSVLNELIAIKSELNILVDKNIEPLNKYTVEVINDELMVTDGDGIPFSYNPIFSASGEIKWCESQRIQETLFHEKQTIIENCLFGVDINPNSVKICRLRLWIELLKNAYYISTDKSRLVPTLETLPNIDINIKCGNSLISRFGLDADLKKALKQSKWNIESYKLAVATYRNADSKEQKREMERLIADIKSNFRSEIATNDPKKLKLEKLKGELFNYTQQVGLFERSKKEQTDWNKKVNTLGNDINALDAEIEDIKSNKIYENAFEWRFEFPDVLNDDGDFVGFDVIIGNPPYISAVNMKRNDIEKEYFKSKYPLIDGTYDIYLLFIHLISKISIENSNYSFIIPNKFLIAKYSERLLNFLIADKSIQSSINLSKHNVFDEAAVYPIIINGHLKNSTNFTKFTVNNIEDFIENGALIEENTQKKYTTFKDFGFKIQGGLAGFQADSVKEYISTSKTDDNIEFTVSGGVDRYHFHNKKIRYMGFTYDQCFINKNCNLSNEKMKFWINPKIVIAGMTKKIESVFVQSPLGLGVGIYGIQDLTSEQGYYLSAILNSKFISSYFNEKFKDKALAGGYLAINKNTIEEIPYIHPDDDTIKKLTRLSLKIHGLKSQDPQADTSDLENEIDQLVYQLYELTEEEIAVVKAS